VSKYDSNISPADAVSDELAELLATLGGLHRPGPDRADAMAQYLSGEDGWRDARQKLRGAFAKGGRGRTGLIERKDK
jgi:hypothetical protein